MASDLALKNHKQRAKANASYRQTLLKAIAPLNPTINGDQNRVLPHVINVSFPGLDSEAVMVALKKLVAISNGSACTSHKYEPSHVLGAMGLSKEVIQGALRFSWCHTTEKVDWKKIVTTIKSIQ
jgi:cysteine desulfurase